MNMKRLDYFDVAVFVEELMEETFYKIITKKPKFNGKYTFKTWLYTIGRNVAIDYLRHNSKMCDISFDDLENYIEGENKCESENNPSVTAILSVQKSRQKEKT